MTDEAMPDVSTDQKDVRATVLYFDAGGGHRAAAFAIQSVLNFQPNWRVELLNLQEYLDALDPTRKLVGVRVQDLYNRLLNRGSTRLMYRLLPVLHAAVRVYTPLIASKLARRWAQSRPDIVISVVPNLNRAIARSVRKAIPNAPFVTVITDFADTPPHFWIERQSQYLVCGTQRAAEQALAIGHDRQHVFQTSGMVLHPRFYSKPSFGRAEIRAKLGLKPDLTTVLVMFGGQGSREMLQIAKGLNQCTSPMQVAYICGRNETLRRELELLEARTPRIVTGFTTDVPDYMAAADLMVGKPGPGSVSEALHFGVPVIVCRNASTMPQEVYNTYWIEEQGVGVVLRDFSSIAQTVDSIISSGKLRELRNSAAGYRNEAIFEIPLILKKILENHSDISAAVTGKANTASS